MEMERTHTLSTDYAIANTSVRLATDIPKLTHREAGVMATQELERTLAVLESLDGDDWHQPTACTMWNVWNMVSHLAGACAGHASWAEFRRQTLQNPYWTLAFFCQSGRQRFTKVHNGSPSL